MKTIVSASRRTDLVAHFSGWLASALREERVSFRGPSGRVREVDLTPDGVHSVVLWSKDFSNLIADRDGLRAALLKYGQVYFHFTVTGLGGTFLERGVRRPEEALEQVRALIDIAGSPKRVSLRFDPLVFWREGGEVRTNLGFFARIAAAAAEAGISDLRLSFAQWYRKARLRAARLGLDYIDPAEAEKTAMAREMAALAGSLGLVLYACSQRLITEGTGVRPSSCIDGKLLQELHPRREPVSLRKDRSQRAECLCTESVDIGSYVQACPQGCLYCYANPAV